jgi:hypothetical protein
LLCSWLEEEELQWMNPFVKGVVILPVTTLVSWPHCHWRYYKSRTVYSIFHIWEMAMQGGQ